MRPRIPVLVAGWLAGAAAAATAVTLALSALGSGLFGTAGHPLSIAQVQQQLAQAGQEPSTATAGPPQPIDQDGTSGAKNTNGGSVVVRCTSQGALLMAATPALGYRADDLLQGPAPAVWVSFRSDSAEAHVAASCAAGKPRFTVTSEPHGDRGGGSPSPGTVPASGVDDHGGGHGGGTPGGSGGTSGGSGGTSGGSGGSGGTSGGSGGGGSNGGGGGGDG
jgi:hypothetical protein